MHPKKFDAKYVYWAIDRLIENGPHINNALKSNTARWEIFACMDMAGWISEKTVTPV